MVSRRISRQKRNTSPDAQRDLFESAPVPNDALRNPACKDCPLWETATTVCVGGAGPKDAKIMIVGEAPGADEDRAGIPFIGKSGRLLREELAKVGIDPNKAYITNTVKCRPPDNRNPSAKEIKACKRYLEAELATVKPEYVIALGAPASKTVLKKSKITEQHGQITADPRGFRGMAAFHPAYCLRDPSKLPVLQKDLKRITDEIRGTKKKSIFKWKMITQENLLDFYRDLENSKWFSFDLETSGLEWFNPEGRYVRCISIALDSTGEAWVLPLSMPQSPFESRISQMFVVRTIASRTKRLGIKGIAHNGKFDNLWLDAVYGVTFPLDFDTMLAHHTLDENAPHGLKELSTYFFDAPYYDLTTPEKKGNVEPKKLYRYGARDALYTLWLKDLFLKQLKKQEGQWKLFDRLVMRASRAFHRIEKNGLYVNLETFRGVRKQVVKDRDQALIDLNKLVEKYQKDPINWNSPAQVANLFFEKLKLPIIERTAGGNPSTGEATLVALKEKHPVCNQLVKYRELDKFLGTYIDGWKSLMQGPSLYFSTKLHGTVTGRYSSRLHQTPRDGTIRNVIEAPPGWTFVQGDFSQAELRVVAIISGDPELMKCFREGIDVHWRTLLYTIQAGGSGEYVKPAIETAQKISGRKKLSLPDAIDLLTKAGHEKSIEIWKGWKEARKKAKGINFGFVYGMMEKKFIEYAKLKYGFEPTEHEAKALREAYFSLYRGLKPWHDRQKRLVKLDGFVRSLAGRLRRLPGIYSSDKVLSRECERQAINAPIQGFIGDFKAMALVELAEKLDWDKARVVGEVHDSILFWVRTEYLEEQLPIIARIMRNPELAKEFHLPLSVPIDCDLEVGPWGKGKPWKQSA